MTVPSLCGFLIIASFFWLSGYVTPYQKDDYEMRLPNFIKIFYGKTNRPLGLRGFFLQTLGIVLGVGFLIEYLAYEFNRPVLMPAGSLFILSGFLIGVPGLIQVIINHKRKKSGSSQ